MIMKKLEINKFDSIEVNIIRKLDREFIKEWSILVNQTENAHFFNTPAWFVSCLDAYNIYEYFIFAAYKGYVLVGVLPLVKEKKFGMDVYTTPGKRYLEKSSILVKSNSPYILNKLISEVLEYGNIYLTEVSEEIAESLSINKKKGLLTLSSINPYIRLNENPLGTLADKQIKRIKGKINNNFENLRFGHFRNNLGTHLQSVFELEGRSSKKLAGKDSFADLKIRELFISLINYAKGFVVIDFVYHKSSPIVSSFGFVFKDRYLAYHTSFDNNFRSFIPGKLITFNMLTKLYEEGFSLFDFSRGHNEFKNDFTKNYVFQYDFYYSKNPLIRIWWESIHLARRLKARLIKNKRSLDGEYLFRRYKNSPIALDKMKDYALR